jgi:hypothetical protein
VRFARRSASLVKGCSWEGEIIGTAPKFQQSPRLFFVIKPKIHEEDERANKEGYSKTNRPYPALLA